MNEANTQTTSLVIGLDLGDRFSQACFLDEATGKELRQVRLRTTERDIVRVFGQLGRQRLALEVGTHSPWVSRLLGRLGHEVVVANPREVRLIAQNRRKSDPFDARALARLARLDPELLSPVQHRSMQAQQDLAVVRARAAVVSTRTMLVNHLRGAVKSLGGKLPKYKFGHLAEHRLPSGLVLIDSYHCSRYNQNTGRLTAAMFDAVFARALERRNG